MVDLRHTTRTAATDTVLFTLALHALPTTSRPVLNLTTPLCRRYQLLSFRSLVSRVRRLRLRTGVQSCEVNGSFGCLTGHLHLTSLPGTGKGPLERAGYAGNALAPQATRCGQHQPRSAIVWESSMESGHGFALWASVHHPPLCTELRASEHKIVTSCT